MRIHVLLRLALFIMAGLLAQEKLYGQLTANFSASPVSGCAPLVVNFTDLSSGNPTSWKWTLGNGVTSVLKNPSATYFNPGTYTVKLVIYNASGSDSIVKHQYITVNAAPVVNFTASDTTGCFPLAVQFSDISQPGSGTVTGWNWDFGDGTTSTLQNPVHIYQSAGNYTVTLKVTNSNGCHKTIFKTQYIKITSGVTSSFTHTTGGQCTAPVQVAFSNASTGPGSLSSYWDFGDGSTSTATSPSHIYTSNGSYTVKLITISSQGCADTLVMPDLVMIGNYNTAFSIPPGICAGEIFTVTDNSLPLPSSSAWDFGDGITATGSSPSHSYASPGIYQVRLVNDYGGCPDTLTQSITVFPKPAADFSTPVTDFCKIPATVNFSSQAQGAVSWLWDFGDGNTSSSANPVHSYTTEGNFTVTLTVTGAGGCTDIITKTDYISVQKPVVTVTGLPQNGCIPVTINPVASVNAIQPVTAYSWDFGDGNTGTGPNPSHTYTNAGTYTITLVVTTAGGCTDTLVLQDIVKAGTQPQAAFSVQPGSACAYQQVVFTDQSLGNPDQWLWDFGDGGTSSAQHPVYSYQDTGWFTVTLYVWNNTCPDTVKITDVIHIKPPVAKFAVTPDCVNRFKKEFTDQSIGPETWYWDFGDGNTSSVQNPSHIYTAPGSYTVTLTVTNDSCSHSTQKLVHIIDETADFTAPAAGVCRNTPVQFNPSGINPANIASWQWDFGDGSNATGSPAIYSFSQSGNYLVSLTITDLNGCTGTISRPVTVFGPAAAFTPVNPIACHGNADIYFNDSSAGDGTNPIIQWIWNYGDGTMDSVSQPPYHHQYQNTGSYPVTLTVRDSYGCIDSMLINTAVTVTKPVASFSATDTAYCLATTVQFSNTSAGNNLQYAWDFGDGGTSALQSPAHDYTAPGSYTVILVVTDDMGCTDTMVKTAFIQIIPPVASFTMSDSVGSCPPLMIDFTNSSSNYNSVHWNFGDGTSSVLNNPGHFYPLAGNYTVTLTVTGVGGCKDSVSREVIISGPTGEFTYTPQSGCSPVTVSFTATSEHRDYFVWDFSDGNTLTTTDSVVSHTYTTPGVFLPKLILVGPNGCSVPLLGDLPVTVTGADADFVIHNNEYCDSGSVTFIDSTVMNDAVTSYLWDFGDGSTSTLQNPVHHYSSPGIYTVQLVVATVSGCIDTSIRPAAVYIHESPEIGITGDSVACAPAKIQFGGVVMRGDSLAWKWNFNHVSANQQAPVAQTYQTAGLYTVSAIVTDINGCRDTAVKQVNIYPVPVVDAGPDAVACLGSAVQLQAGGAATYQWAPSPGLSCLSCAQVMAAPSGDTVYYVTGTNQYGCSATDSVHVRVRMPFVLQKPPDDSICAGGSIQLVASGADLYQWTPAAGLGNPGAASTTATPTATTVYTLIAADADNCFQDTAQITVSVFPIPTVNAGSDLQIEAGASIQMQATGSADITSWKWIPGSGLSCTTCPDPLAKPSKTTDYRVEVSNPAGCQAEDQLRIIVTCGKGNLFIPNTFSPNGDGSNDRFYPRGTGITRIKSLRVYNRWGEIVFERRNFNANDASAGWDGMFRGMPASADVYIYTCEVLCLNNEVLEYKGDISLLR